MRALAAGRMRSSVAVPIPSESGARFVAKAVTWREAAGGRKRSCGPRPPGARDWAKASVVAVAESSPLYCFQGSAVPGLQGTGRERTVVPALVLDASVSDIVRARAALASW